MHHFLCRRLLLEIHRHQILHLRLLDHPPRLRLRRHVPHGLRLLLVLVPVRQAQQRRHALGKRHPLRYRVRRDARGHVRGDLQRQLGHEHEPELQPRPPHLVVLVVGQSRPPREEPPPQLQGELEEPVEEPAQAFHVLLHQELPPEDREVPLGDVGRGPHGVVRPRRRPVRVPLRGGQFLADRPRRAPRPHHGAAQVVPRARVDHRRRAPEPHHALILGGEGTSHGYVAVLLLLDLQHFDAQVLEARHAPFLALPKRQRRTRHEGGLLEEDPVSLEGHGVHERRRLLRPRQLVGTLREVIGAVIEEGHRLLEVRTREFLVGRGAPVHPRQQPVGDLKPGRGGLDPVVLEHDARLVAGAVHHQLGSDSRHLPVLGFQQRRRAGLVVDHGAGGGVDVHRRGRGNVVRPRHPVPRPSLPRVLRLHLAFGTESPPQRVPIDATVRPVQPHPLLHGYVEAPPEEAVGDPPQPIDASVPQRLVEGGVQVADGLPLVLPHAVVGDPTAVVVGVGEEDVERRGGGRSVLGRGGGEEGGDGSRGGAAPQDQDVAFVARGGSEVGGGGGGQCCASPRGGCDCSRREWRLPSNMMR
mmetsp:Transcript_21902/g.46903  ORF Transcript_21902/g.46903 Transcript_21902/m.46903 type:complete len:585 (-) Transcript_21902:149-1903(-)